MDGKYNCIQQSRNETALWSMPQQIGCGPFRGSVVTLTFSWNVRGETADLKLKQWLNTVERELKARVCFVASKECKPPSFEWRCLGTSTYWLPLKSQYRRNYAKAPGGIWFVLVRRIPAWGR